MNMMTQRRSVEVIDGQDIPLALTGLVDRVVVLRGWCTTAVGLRSGRVVAMGVGRSPVTALARLVRRSVAEATVPAPAMGVLRS
ncbi:MAG: hypothetical protein ACR2MA_02115 [Egibacteraceae bacterium]